MKCRVSECCSCLSDPLIDLSVQEEVIGDCWSKVCELVIRIKLVVIDGDGWWWRCILPHYICLLQADGQPKVLERRGSWATAISAGCESHRQQTADLWWGRRATSQVVPSWGWSRLLMILVELIFCIRSVGQCWGVHTDQSLWSFGPLVVFRRRVMSHSEPPLPSSTKFSKLFLTAKPTPWGLVRANSLPIESVVLLLQFPCAWCPEDLQRGLTSKSTRDSNIPVQELVSFVEFFCCHLVQ